MKKAASYIPLLIAILMCALSCGREERFGTGPDSGFGAIELRLGSGSAVRLETKTLADSLKDGFYFNNVLVVLTDNEDIVVGSVYKAYPYVPGVSDLQDAVAETSVMEDVIHFEHLLPGNYQVYAYANIDATEWQDSGNLISANEKLVAPGDTFTPFLSRELLSLNSADTSVPGNPSTKMLLTGQKTISVGLSVATETLDLLRPVVRVKVTVKNNTPYPVSVDTLYFSGFNPDKAYLLDHRGSGSVPIVPGGVTYRELPAYPILSATPDTVRANSDSLVYQTLVYENAYSSPYTIYGDFTLDRSSQTLSSLTMSLGGDGGSFGPISYTTFNSMPDGTYVDVLVINPRNATRSGRLYYGVGDTGIAWESCGYNSYTKFVDRAEALYNQDASHLYVDYKYTGMANNKSGLVGWTGNNADNPEPYPRTSNATYTFDYTNARSRYFRKITKNGNNDYTIDGLSTSTTSLTGMGMQQGAINDASRFPSDLNGSLLVTFTKGGKYLKSDCVWSSGEDVGKAKKSTLSWDASCNQDHQFILFGYYNPGNPGAPMKRILKENNKEVPLTYMSRNEDINIVINIFYADQEGSIDFLVDNSTWADDYSTTSSHTFN